MTSTERESGLISDPPAADSRPRPSGQLADRGDLFWLDGDVLACACPDCQAPMSLRLWLRVADCWRCGASVELTAEQQQQAWRLLAARRATQTPPAPTPPRPAAAIVAAAEIQPSPGAPPREAPFKAAAPSPTFAAHSAAASRPLGVPPAVPPTATPLDSPAPPRPPAVPRRRGLPEHLTSWLASALVHMLAVIALGLWLIEVRERPRPLILATDFNALDQSGDAQFVDPSVTATSFEPPGAGDSLALAPALPSAEEMSQPEVTLDANLTGLLPSQLDRLLIGGDPADPSRVLAGRDPRVRAQLALRAGGTTRSEAAVARALHWLAEHQNRDGGWSLDAFDEAGSCRGACSHPGVRSETAGTALALLPFLGAGQTPRQGEYRLVVARGLRRLVEQQAKGGDLRGSGMGRMYAHGLATIALCEAYALSHDSQVADPAQRAVDFIVKAQHRGGGWRYEPQQPGDTSVVGWQLMALRSAQMAALHVPSDAFRKAARFLDNAQTEPSRGLYSYMPGGPPSPAMTAEGLLSRQYSGWPRHRRGLIEGVDWLLANHLPRRGAPNMYYWYYGTQVMHHMGGEPWQEWNYRLRDMLVEMQETVGHAAGSWTPESHHDVLGGRLYMTALAACTLEVYYRHLPLYSGSAVEHAPAGGAAP